MTAEAESIELSGDGVWFLAAAVEDVEAVGSFFIVPVRSAERVRVAVAATDGLNLLVVVRRVVRRFEVTAASVVEALRDVDGETVSLEPRDRLLALLVDCRVILAELVRWTAGSWWSSWSSSSSSSSMVITNDDEEAEDTFCELLLLVAWLRKVMELRLDEAETSSLSSSMTSESLWRLRAVFGVTVDCDEPEDEKLSSLRAVEGRRVAAAAAAAVVVKLGGVVTSELLGAVGRTPILSDMDEITGPETPALLLLDGPVPRKLACARRRISV